MPMEMPRRSTCTSSVGTKLKKISISQGTSLQPFRVRYCLKKPPLLSGPSPCPGSSKSGGSTKSFGLSSSQDILLEQKIKQKRYEDLLKQEQEQELAEAEYLRLQAVAKEAQRKQLLIQQEAKLEAQRLELKVQQRKMELKWQKEEAAEALEALNRQLDRQNRIRMAQSEYEIAMQRASALPKVQELTEPPKVPKSETEDDLQSQPSFAAIQTPLPAPLGMPGSAFNPFSPAGQQRKTTLSPAQVDPFYTQGDALSSEDQLDDTWITVFGFPPASASYILLQFAQYGNIIKHVMSNTGNWMHIQYQSKLQARKALSKDGKIFGDSIMIGVKPCIDKSVMEISDKISSTSSVFTPPLKALGTPSHPPSTPRSVMRPLIVAQKASSSDYQVVSDQQTPKKDDSFVSKAMEYMFGW